VGVSAEQAAIWFPDGRSILFAGREGEHGKRLYSQSIEGGKPRPITPEGIIAAIPGFAISSDGLRAAAVAPDHKAAIFPLDGGSARPVPGALEGEYPLRFSDDGRSLYLWKRGDVPARISRIEIDTGRREVWKDLLPADPAGVERISNVLITPDGKGYAYCYVRLLSDLFIVEGLK
jgi:WD40 repeat protein